jgi:hypothetical protein
MPIFGLHTPGESLKERFLKEYVGWCVAPRRNDVLGSMDLPNILYGCQLRLGLASSYKIDKASTFDFVKAIIKDFNEYLIDLYFNDMLSYSSDFSVLSKGEYFLYMFEKYLYKKISKRELAGRVLAIEKDRVNYGSWGLSQHYTATHQFTDDGLVVAKLYYIVSLACSKSYKIVRINGAYHPEYSKKYVDDRSISVSCG